LAGYFLDLLVEPRLLIVKKNKCNFWEVAAVSDIVLDDLTDPKSPIPWVEWHKIWLSDFDP